MNNKVFILFIFVHAAIGLAAYLALSTWAVGAADSGVTPADWVGVLDRLVRFVLLQPLAYWIIDAWRVPWWTWPGLGILLSVCLVNSLVLAWLLRRLLAARANYSGSNPH